MSTFLKTGGESVLFSKLSTWCILVREEMTRKKKTLVDDLRTSRTGSNLFTVCWVGMGRVRELRVREKEGKEGVSSRASVLFLLLYSVFQIIHQASM